MKTSSLIEVVGDKTYTNFFHLDKKHSCRFDNAVFQNGVTYDHKNKSKGIEGSIVTAAKLRAINSLSQLKAHIKDVAEEILRPFPSIWSMPESKAVTSKKVDFYKLALCVIIAKEKMSASTSKKRADLSPVSTTTVRVPGTSESSSS